MDAGLYGLPPQIFLVLYAILFLGACGLSLVIPPLLRPEGRSNKVTDLDQMAYLAGGSVRLCESVAFRLLQRGSITLSGRDIHGAWPSPPLQTPAEHAFMQALPANWPRLLGEMEVFSKTTVQKLATAGLVVGDAQSRQIRWLTILPLALLLLFGGARWVVGIQMGHPVAFLTIMLVVTLVVTVAQHQQSKLLTNQGLRTLGTAEAEAAAMRYAPTLSEMPLAVSLFGASILAGSSFFILHEFLWSTNDGAGGGGDSGGGGGGGCGGCGGCGG
jgi:uncharacterized protein (TIGR04222 family)